jgi:hypothetical protein
MPGPGTAEPDIPGVLTFRLDNVTVLSPPPNPTAIVQAGQELKLKVDLGFDGHPLFLNCLMAGKQYSVFHHLEREEDGARTTLSGGTFTVPAPSAISNFSVETGPYTSGGPGSGTQFEVPAGFDAGTFEVTTHIHFVDSCIKSFVAAFHQVYVMVTT